MKKARRAPFIFAAFLAILPAACNVGGEGLVVSGRIERDDAHIGSKIGGRIMQVLHQEGDEVKSGDLILLLDDRELKAQLAQARGAAAQAQAQLDLLLAGTRAEEIRRAEATVAAQQAELKMRREGFRAEEVRQAEAQLASARADLELQRKELKRNEELMQEGVIAQRDLDQRRNAFKTAQAAVDQAQQRAKLYQSGSRPEEIRTAEAQLAQAEADLTRLKNGPRPEEITAQRAALQAAQANIDRIQTQLDETRITAPNAAVIDTLDLRPGDLVKAGEPVAVLYLLVSPYVRCYVPENRLGWVKPGQAVAITVDSFPGRRFKGRVRHVSTEAEFTPRNVQTTEKRAELVFEMKVDVLENQEQMRPGMYADVHIARPR